MKSYLVNVDDKLDRKIIELSKKEKMPKYELLPLLLRSGLRYHDERQDAAGKS